jgi:hypothetical protein
MRHFSCVQASVIRTWSQRLAVKPSRLITQLAVHARRMVSDGFTDHFRSPRA